MRAAVSRSPRRGGVSISALLLIPVLALCLVLAVMVGEAARARTALQTVADAAALAAAGEIIDDALLTAQVPLLEGVVQAAREKARATARVNPVLAGGTDLLDEDIEFGERGQAGFTPLDLSGDRVIGLGGVTAVRVSAHRTVARQNPLNLLRGPMLNRVPTDATAVGHVRIDRDVIGVRPLPGLPAPLAPIGLKSDPAGMEESSWEGQTAGAGGDGWGFARVSGHLVPVESPDGLAEMNVRLSGDRANGLLLQLGTTDLDGLAAQVSEGVRNADLALFGGELVLDEDGTRIVPATTTEGAGAGTLAEALLARRGEAMVWPLYSRVNEEGRAVVSGFVAARVATVSVDSGRILLKLQPACRVVAASVTARSRGRTGSDNKYLARLRLAD